MRGPVHLKRQSCYKGHIKLCYEVGPEGGRYDLDKVWEGRLGAHIALLPKPCTPGVQRAVGQCPGAMTNRRVSDSPLRGF